jgi:hypothetical protein
MMRNNGRVRQAVKAVGCWLLAVGSPPSRAAGAQSERADCEEEKLKAKS